MTAPADESTTDARADDETGADESGTGTSVGEVAGGYAAAIDELETILDELETDDLDVDVLADKVARAATLVRFCRRRIGDARVEVEAIVADLDADDVPDAD